MVPGRTSLTFVPLRHGPACVIDRGMTTDTTNRRSIALIVAGFTLLLVAGAGWIHTSPRAPLGIPVHWDLTGTGGMNSDFGQHHAFEPTQAESMTTLEVHVEIWPTSSAPADKWLTQTIDYGFNTVTITLRILGTDENSPGPLPRVGNYYDTGGWVTVALSEPLRSRNLVDGATGKVVPYPPAP